MLRVIICSSLVHNNRMTLHKILLVLQNVRPNNSELIIKKLSEYSSWQVLLVITDTFVSIASILMYRGNGTETTQPSQKLF